VPERELKNALLNALDCHDIRRAYLARVHYGNLNEFHVALCLRPETRVSRRFDQEISGIFAEIFGSNEHLDTIVLDDETENKLVVCCKSFYP